MTQVTVDVNDKRIDDAVRKELKRLEGQVRRLKLGNAKLKSQIREQQETVARAWRRIMTKKEIIAEIRRLIKPRIYLIRFWGTDVIEIEAAWISDTSVSIEGVDLVLISRNRKRRIFTTEQIQADLTQFQSDVHNVCDASDAIAKKDNCDRQEQFEALLLKAQAQNDRKR